MLFEQEFFRFFRESGFGKPIVFFLVPGKVHSKNLNPEFKDSGKREIPFPILDEHIKKISPDSDH